jgi:signal transduction histidine kinase
MTFQPKQSLSARLTRMNLVVSGVVLLLAGLAFFSYDLVSFRHTLIRNIGAEAQIVGENSISALTFDDHESATTTLKSLEQSPDVRGAILSDARGRMFAQYGQMDPDDVAAYSLGAREGNHVWFKGTQVIVARRVIFQGKTVGIVTISAQLTEIAQRARQYLLIAGIILLFCMAAAVVISATSRRLIARPISKLADTALLVSRDKDYSVRAKIPVDGSEIGILVDAFNTMLTQIQERDAALSEAQAELEARVEERTAELRTANRELEAFSYTVAHDLRGPLDAIAGIAFLLAKTPEVADEPKAHGMLDQLTASTVNMSTLIDDLLNFARASTTPIRSAPVDLSKIAREIAADLKMSNPGRRVEFSIMDAPEVPADPGLMRIVLDNLLRNAWKYSSHHDEACIEFGAKVDGGKVVYFVRDDGAGFDPEHAERLFEPFERLHGKSEFPGTGIGLATVQRILARQGGTIWAEGAVEKGATFYFTLG